MTELPTTVFGSGAGKVTRIGLGGEGVLRTRNRKAEAREVIHEAIQQKITYFDPPTDRRGFQTVCRKTRLLPGNTSNVNGCCHHGSLSQRIISLH